ncbi:Carboxy-terminal processing protease CtpB [Polaribacter huanghezhanensis]|uniref:S41 family peptidase n=1 Tax=Polaribacter huanghezhanensis TaxID=1354726 RepID=UPI00264A4319|nr:S41 family peptidase [Polaribacter huanghezhanensis]WKD85267.1 Carboxy-terminal processing protease CtpB [Polaribacter huanghezhanensis]
MKNKNYLPIYFAFAIVFGVLIGSFFNGGNSSRNLFAKKSSNEAKIKRLMDYIQRDYVDSVNTENLLDGAITQILGKLDPHSVYIPKENLQAITENMQGNFVGIGVQFRMIKDSITVIQPIKGGPSIKAGIKAGDRILMADKDTLFGKNYSSNAIPKFLKGKSNTTINLQVYRKSTDSLFTISLKRGKVAIKSVDVSYMINDSIGYIKLERFARTSYSEFKTALTKLQEKGMTDLVLDLRGNGGGYVDIATKIVDEFLEDGKLIVFTKDNKGTVDESYATNRGAFENGGLYILIDQNSASASEIVAGALQDNDRGTTIGRRSFGKGLVQEELDLGDGSAVRLTIARYYTPTGRSIQKPYEKGKGAKYSRDINNRIKSGELLNRDSIKVVDSLQFTTPKGKVVYGGGGIIPDVFVAVDTTSYLNNFYFNTIQNFAFDLVDANRKELSKNSLDSFLKNYDINKSYKEYLKSINTTLKDSKRRYAKRFKPSKKVEKTLKEYLKATIASQIYGDDGFYRVIQADDKMLQKVLELESNN